MNHTQTISPSPLREAFKLSTFLLRGNNELLRKCLYFSPGGAGFSNHEQSSTGCPALLQQERAHLGNFMGKCRTIILLPKEMLWQVARLFLTQHCRIG